MNRYKIVLGIALLFLFFAINVSANENKVAVTATANSTSDIEVMKTVALRLLSGDSFVTGVNQIVLWEYNQGELDSNGIQYDIIIDDFDVYLETVQGQLNNIVFPGPDAPIRSTLSGLGGISLFSLIDPNSPSAAGNSWYSIWENIDEVDKRLDTLKTADTDNVMRVLELGETHQQTSPIKALHFGNENAPAILVAAAQHGDEWMAYMTAMYIADRLMFEIYDGNSTVISMLEETKVIIVPVVNPDGVDYAWTSSDRLWRKNRAPAPAPVNQNCMGVDINRNWSIEWSNGGSSDSCDTAYRGEEPFSEPETIALQQHILVNNVIRILDMHSNTESINYNTFTDPKRSSLSKSVAEGMESALEADMSNSGYTDYRLSGGNENGTFRKWATENNYLIYAFELPENQVDTIIGADDIQPTVEQAYKGFLYFWDLKADNATFEVDGAGPDNIPDGDPDQDGIFDLQDNCVNEANFFQRDCDGNGIGDACEIPAPSCERALIFAVDESGSMLEADGFTGATREQHALSAGAASLVHSFLLPGTVSVSMLNFSRESQCVTTGDGTKCSFVDVHKDSGGNDITDPDDFDDSNAGIVTENFYSSYNPRGGKPTNILGAVDTALESFMDYGSTAGTERFIFLVTDGKQTVLEDGTDGTQFHESYAGTGKSFEEIDELFNVELEEYKDKIVKKISGTENDIGAPLQTDIEIIVGALAVTPEADIELLAELARESNGFVAYADDSSAAPVYWYDAQANLMPQLSTIDIGDLYTPSTVVGEQEPEGSRSFYVGEDATAMIVMLTNNGTGAMLPVDDNAPVPWSMNFTLKSEDGNTVINQNTLPDYSQIDGDTLTMYIAGSDLVAGEWTLSATTGTGSQISANFSATVFNPKAALETDVDKSIVADGEAASISPTLVYAGIPLDANTTNCIVSKVVGPDRYTIYHEDEDAFLFENTYERISQGLPPIVEIEPFNGRGFYVAYIKCEVDDSAQSVPGTVLTETVNPFTHTSTVTFFFDSFEMPECSTEDCDNDGIPNTVEGYDDTDLDGWPDYFDTDSDNDGVLDVSDNCRIVMNPYQEDSDGDEIGDRCDADLVCMYGEESVWVADRAVLDASIGSNQYIEVGADAQIVGHLKSVQDVFLRERAQIVGHVWAGGIVDEQNYVDVTGGMYENMNLSEMNVPVKGVNYGIISIEVSPDYGCEQSLAAGAYDQIMVRAGCALTLQGGEYDVFEFNISPDATLTLEGSVKLDVENKFEIGDRALVDGITSASDFMVYTNQESQVRIGVDATFTGNIQAPKAEVAIFTHAIMDGCVHSRTLRIEPEANIVGGSFPANTCGNGTLEEDEQCDDDNNNNNDDCLNSCQNATCTDGYWAAYLETDVDCGGVCDACDLGKFCEVDSDCVSEVCEMGICVGDKFVEATLNVDSQWDGGYCVSVSVANDGDAVSTWTVQMSMGDAQLIAAWNGEFSMLGDELAVDGASLGTGESTTFGFCANGTTGVPTIIDAMAF